MSATPAAAVRTQTQSPIIAILAALALMVLWFIVTRALRYAEYSQTTYGNYYWPRRWALVPHILGGLTALTTGLVQLWLGLTNRVTRLHRVLGKVYTTGILVGATSVATAFPWRFRRTMPRTPPASSCSARHGSSPQAWRCLRFAVAT